MGVNAFTLAAQAVNPKIATKLVMLPRSGSTRPRGRGGRRRWPISAATSLPSTSDKAHPGADRISNLFDEVSGVERRSIRFPHCSQPIRLAGRGTVEAI